ncbi:auxin-binding protein ABP20-like [Vicia villosa]|uniref:auxin-binding protein ABP20-like n=1 Tax=Vicia villosa TaxID=3911 RepID=UPI00273AAABC|nr:auxin-binding protein ABP20-like [Vicia villosa]
MKMIHIILLFFYLLSYTSHATYTNDFCVANFMFPKTPSGYPCKSETNVTADDFASSTLVAGDSKNIFNLRSATAFVNDIPGLNGLGISAARVDFDINGTVPMHIHPDSSELIIVAQGQIYAGFITPTKLYEKNLKVGDVFVFPTGLLHFLVNTGPKKAMFYAVYGSSNPSIQLLVDLLFRNKLPTPIIQKTTLLDSSQIMKLKAQFGGSG